VVIVLAIAIAARVTRPILELRQQLVRLVRGDFEPIPLPRRDDELRDLIGSVNTLADELDASRRAIERSERLSLLGQLSGGLAHQLRNSVTGARIALQLHQRRCDRIDQDSLAVALRQLNITEAHLQRFLTVGQPSAPRRARCDLRETIDEVADLLAPACKHRGVDLQIDVDLGGQADLLADVDQLRQLLLNLLVNAIEAAGTGGWVRVELAALADAMVVRVVDSGRGLDPKLVDRLFEPFATAKPEGIGLGLSVARRIAESHGGAIRYLDGQPTTFEVTLPRDAVEPVDCRP
jgi:signal transduction histidine kinase